MPSSNDLAQDLVDAIHTGRLRARIAALVASGIDDPLVGQAERALAALDRRQWEDRLRWSSRFAEADITHDVAEPDPTSLISVPELVIDPVDLDAALAEVERWGLRRWTPSAGAAAEAVRRTTDRLMLASVADVPERVTIRWRDAPSPLASLAPRATDLTGPTLPAALWLVHVVRRLARVAAGRIGRDHSAPDLGPLLVTPVPLADALMASLELTDDDVVVDLGCGDGRLLVAALGAGAGAAIGLEVDPVVAALARERVHRAGWDDRARIHTTDAAGHDLGEATVVVMFIAAWAAAEQVAAVRRRVGPGVRIVAHELEPIATQPPGETTPLFTDRAISVRHLWTA